MQYRAEFGVVAIARDAVTFLSLVLTMTHLVDDVVILGNDKRPVAETLADYFLSFPAEEFLCRRLPAQHFELVVPFDYGERSVVDVKSEAPVFVER